MADPPDPAPKLEACFRDVVRAVRARGVGDRPLFLGGKSMGGRMASHLGAAWLVDAWVEGTEDGGLVIDAGAKNTAIASHRAVRERYPVLAQAILAGASAQIRNMATVGGNLMQRTRCYYFYDDAARCNKRERGKGCDAIEGFNRIHAILGASSHCVATHPSDM